MKEKRAETRQTTLGDVMKRFDLGSHNIGFWDEDVIAKADRHLQKVQIVDDPGLLLWESLKALNDNGWWDESSVKTHRGQPASRRKNYNVILVDPPWKYDKQSLAKYGGVSYPTLPTSRIMGMKPFIDRLAAKDCMLYLWAVSPKVPEAVDVMRAWEFDYLTSMMWDKVIPRIGYWFRGQHELLLLGRRGKVSPPVPTNRLPSIYQEKSGRHSAKPEKVYGIVESYPPPTQTRIELFARKTKPGWDAWGNEI